MLFKYSGKYVNIYFNMKITFFFSYYSPPPPKKKNKLLEHVSMHMIKRKC